MNKVSLKLNERTSSIPVFSTVNEILDEYYKLYPIENDDEYGLLYDTYSLINEFFDIVGCKYDKKSRLLLANYIYRSKGSINSIYELFRILWGDNSDTIEGTPNYTIEFKYNVRGYNQLYRNPNEDLLFSKNLNVNISNEDPLNVYFPLVTTENIILKPFLLNSSIKDFVSIKQTISDPSEIVSESIEETPEWAINNLNKEGENIYSGEVNIENTSFKTEIDSSTPTTKKQIDSLNIKCNTDGTFCLSGKRVKIGIEKTITKLEGHPEVSDGYTWVKTEVNESLQPDGTTITTTIVTCENSNEAKREDLYSVQKSSGDSEYWKESYSYEEEEYNNQVITKDKVSSYLPEDQDFVYNETITRICELKFEDLFPSEKELVSTNENGEEIKSRCYEANRDPLEEEIETVVMTDTYDDGSLKIKKTTQQANNYLYKETEIKSYSIRNGEISSVFERVVDKTSRTIEREYNIKQPQEIVFAKGLTLIQTVTDTGTFKKCFYSDNEELIFIEDKVKEIDVTPQTKNDESGELIFTEADFKKVFTLENKNTEKNGKITYLLSSNISEQDSEESLNAQQYYWFFEEKNVRTITLKDTLDSIDKSNYNVNVVLNPNKEYSKSTDVEINNCRPHVEISLLDGYDEINSDIIVSNFSKNINYLDSREFIVTISNITVIDKKHFQNILEELIRDLLLVSDRSVNGDDPISIKVNLTTYNIDSSIFLKSENSVKQVNNIIPNSYILQGKTIWTSPYTTTN